MSAISVKVGFLPSYRFSFSPWCARMYEESVAALRAVEGLDLVTPGAAEDRQGSDRAEGRTPHAAVHTLDEAEAAAAFFARQGVQALVICPLDFGDERSAALVADRLRVPILLYATAEPPAREDASLARVSDSYCGNLALAAALHRRGLAFRFGGILMPDDPALRGEAARFVSAAAIVAGLKGARVGQVGLRPAPFESCAYSEHEMITKFGQTLVPCELSVVTAAALARPDDDPEVAALVEGIRAGVATVAVSDEHLLRAAKLELALIDFWERNGLSAMAMQCWPAIQRDMGVSTCAIFGRLTMRGMLTACEADVLGALTMLISHRAALGNTVPHFIDWTIRHREDPNTLLAWHCGNAPVCLAADPDRTALRSRGDMQGARQPEFHGQEGLHQFQIRPGPVTLTRLVEYGGEWRLLIAGGEVVPSDEELCGTWSWVRVADHDRLYRTLVENGFIHHAAMIHGDYRTALREACRFLDIGAVVVD